MRLRAAVATRWRSSCRSGRRWTSRTCSRCASTSPTASPRRRRRPSPSPNSRDAYRPPTTTTRRRRRPRRATPSARNSASMRAVAAQRSSDPVHIINYPNQPRLPNKVRLPNSRNLREYQNHCAVLRSPNNPYTAYPPYRCALQNTASSTQFLRTANPTVLMSLPVMVTSPLATRSITSFVTLSSATVFPRLASAVWRWWWMCRYRLRSLSGRNVAADAPAEAARGKRSSLMGSGRSEFLWRRSCSPKKMERWRAALSGASAFSWRQSPLSPSQRSTTLSASAREMSLPSLRLISRRAASSWSRGRFNRYAHSPTAPPNWYSDALQCCRAHRRSASSFPVNRMALYSVPLSVLASFPPAVAAAASLGLRQDPSRRKMSRCPAMLPATAQPMRCANSPQVSIFSWRNLSLGAMAAKEKLYLRSSQQSASTLGLIMADVQYIYLWPNHAHISRYLVQREETRSTLSPRVLLSGSSSASPLNLLRIFSVSLSRSLISTRSMLTSFRSWASLLTMCTDSLPLSPYLNLVPVCAAASGSTASTSKERWKGCWLWGSRQSMLWRMTSPMPSLSTWSMVKHLTLCLARVMYSSVSMSRMAIRTTLLGLRQGWFVSHSQLGKCGKVAMPVTCDSGIPWQLSERGTSGRRSLQSMASGCASTQISFRSLCTLCAAEMVAVPIEWSPPTVSSTSDSPPLNASYALWCSLPSSGPRIWTFLMGNSMGGI